jgi:hypothetical protein
MIAEDTLTVKPVNWGNPLSGTSCFYPNNWICPQAQLRKTKKEGWGELGGGWGLVANFHVIERS